MLGFGVGHLPRANIFERVIAEHADVLLIRSQALDGLGQITLPRFDIVADEEMAVLALNQFRGFARSRRSVDVRIADDVANRFAPARNAGDGSLLFERIEGIDHAAAQVSSALASFNALRHSPRQIGAWWSGTKLTRVLSCPFFGVSRIVELSMSQAEIASFAWHGLQWTAYLIGDLLQEMRRDARYTD